MRRVVPLAASLALCAGAVWAQVAPSDPFVIDPDGPPPPMRDFVAAMFAPYAHALAAMAGWGLLMLVLTVLSVIGSPRARTQAGLPARDYADPYYRRSRAFANAVEASGSFLAVTVAAILVGASPFWVNVLASVFLVARIGAAAAHIGTMIEPLRSAFWSVAVLCTLALGAMALLGAFAL